MKVEKRTEKVNKVRRQGLIPGVIYGKEIESAPIQVENSSLMSDYKAYGKNKTFKVKLANKTHQVYFKDVQLNMANPKEILHFSLLKVTASDTITADIPIHLTGQHEIEKQSLLVQQIMHSLEVEYPANKSIDNIEIDVSNLKLGEGIFVKDIELPEKFKSTVDPEELVVNITYPKVQEVEEPTEETEPSEQTDEEQQTEESAKEQE